MWELEGKQNYSRIPHHSFSFWVSFFHLFWDGRCLISIVEQGERNDHLQNNQPVPGQADPVTSSCCHCWKTEAVEEVRLSLADGFGCGTQLDPGPSSPSLPLPRQDRDFSTALRGCSRVVLAPELCFACWFRQVLVLELCSVPRGIITVKNLSAFSGEAVNSRHLKLGNKSCFKQEYKIQVLSSGVNIYAQSFRTVV